jgi:hypothetical protein
MAYKGDFNIQCEHYYYYYYYYYYHFTFIIIILFVCAVSVIGHLAVGTAH